MKTLSILLIPTIALLVSACAPAPVGPVYGGGYGPTYGYGPGPAPQAGYYWNGTIYVEGRSPYHDHHQYDRSVTNVNDVNVHRTNVNDRTIDRTNVNNTRVNNHTLNRTNVNQTNVKQATVHAAHKHARPTPAP